MKQERTYVAWLAGSIVGGLALVGAASAADVAKVQIGTVRPANSARAIPSSDNAPTCDVQVADGTTVRGNLYNGLCLTNPPAGYIAPIETAADTTVAARGRPIARLVSFKFDPRPCTAPPAPSSFEQA